MGIFRDFHSYGMLGSLYLGVAPVDFFLFSQISFFTVPDDWLWQEMQAFGAFLIFETGFYPWGLGQWMAMRFFPLSFLSLLLLPLEQYLKHKIHPRPNEKIEILA